MFEKLCTQIDKYYMNLRENQKTIRKATLNSISYHMLFFSMFIPKTVCSLVGNLLKYNMKETKLIIFSATNLDSKLAYYHGFRSQNIHCKPSFKYQVKLWLIKAKMTKDIIKLLLALGLILQNLAGYQIINLAEV